MSELKFRRESEYLKSIGCQSERIDHYVRSIFSFQDIEEEQIEIIDDFSDRFDLAHLVTLIENNIDDKEKLEFIAKLLPLTIPNGFSLCQLIKIMKKTLKSKYHRFHSIILKSLHSVLLVENPSSLIFPGQIY
jgi:hypothetical protein